MVQGKSFTSNTTKLLKHLDKLEIIQKGGIPSPVMVHMSVCNPCNLTCSFCCFANRSMKEILPLDRIKLALDSYKALGALGIEFSLRGDEIIPYKDQDGCLRIDTIKNVVENKINANSFSIDKNHKFIEDKITAFYKHPQKEPMYKITVDSGKNITTTGSHSIYFWENNKLIKKPVKTCKLGDKVVFTSKTPQINFIEEIKFQNKTYKINEEFCRLLGYFAAEGSYTFQRKKVPHGIVFTFGSILDKYESIYIKDVINILTNMGFKPIIDVFNNKTNIRLSKKHICELMIFLKMGVLAENKRVPDIILNTSNELKIEFIKGFYAGDGNFRSTLVKEKYNRNILHFKSASKMLQKTMSYLLDTMNINHTIGDGVNNARVIEGRTLNPTDYHYIDITGKESLIKLIDVINHIGGELKYKDSIYSHSKSHTQKTIISDDFYALKIRKIEKLEDIDESVYDITVGDTNKFCSSYNILASNTGGGEPTLHPQFDEIVHYAKDLGYALGICTNGTKLTKHKDLWQYFDYVRLGMYGFDEGYKYDLSVFAGSKTRVSAAYVWDFNTDTSSNPNITGGWTNKSNKKLSANQQKQENFYMMLDWVENNRIPTRIAFNAIKPQEEVLKDIEQIRILIKDHDLKYAFLSDFNYKPYRRNDHCYMHMVKPFVFTDGNVYVCPSSELSVENSYNMNPEFKICDIEGISSYYKSLEGGVDVSMRHHACNFCKYALQNELVDDIVTITENNEFA